ncbi:MAG: protocatechuate 3,4-dioxygenase subunit alpha [Opitutaceae bacterium]|nr:protocatechuate 3,4-dioxygenase subunit alpha [Opitutaceae bacterium]
MNPFKPTPSQTVGPFFSYGLAPEQYGYDYKSLASGALLKEDTQGEAITIVGRILSGTGDLMKNVVVESWQANNEGQYSKIIDKDTFSGFGRFGTGTDKKNRYILHTIKPGRVDSEQAPHIALTLFSRGLMHHAYTRLYFSDETEANEKDPLLLQLPSKRRHTLIAQKAQSDFGAVYQFDIHMQGDDETVFLEF